MADLVVYGPLGETFWSSSMHKSFVLVLFPPSSNTGLGGSGGHPRL